MNTNPTETGMRAECEAHLMSIVENSNVELINKYVKGQKEHGGDLWRKGLATLIGPEIRAEALDLVVYTECLATGLLRVRAICNEGLHAGLSGEDVSRKILSILDGELTDIDKEPVKPVTDLEAGLTMALHALLSYANGNTAPDLAKEVADHLTKLVPA